MSYLQNSNQNLHPSGTRPGNNPINFEPLHSRPLLDKFMSNNPQGTPLQFSEYDHSQLTQTHIDLNRNRLFEAQFTDRQQPDNAREYPSQYHMTDAFSQEDQKRNPLQLSFGRLADTNLDQVSMDRTKFIDQAIRANPTTGQHQQGLEVKRPQPLNLNKSEYQSNYENTTGFSPMTPQDMYTRTPELRKFISLPKEDFGGLPNIGNSCYINSTIQMLFNIEEFRQVVTRSQGSVAKVIGQIFTAINLQESSLKAIDRIKILKYSLRNGKFNNTHQQDAQEFLTDLIETLHEETNTVADASPPRSHIETTDRNKVDDAYREWLLVYFDKTNRSPISNLFYGHTVETTTCLSCCKTKYGFGFFNSMALQISDVGQRAVRAQELVDHFFNEDHIEGFKCDFCKKRVTIVKKSLLYALPKILLLFFKRFDYGIYGNSPRKLQTKIAVQPKLKLDNLAYKPGHYAEYDLIGAVNHYGLINSGHYTATCKKQGRWISFSDIYAIEDKDVSNLLEYGSESVYLCAYSQQFNTSARAPANSYSSYR